MISSLEKEKMKKCEMDITDSKNNQDLNINHLSHQSRINIFLYFWTHFDIFYKIIVPIQILCK